MTKVAPGDVDSKTSQETKSCPSDGNETADQECADLEPREGSSTDASRNVKEVVPDNLPNYVAEAGDQMMQSDDGKKPSAPVTILAVTSQRSFSYNREDMRLADVLPVVVVIALMVALATVVTMYLPQKIGKQNNEHNKGQLRVASFGRSLAMPLRSKLIKSRLGLCGQPPEPQCLAWDWTYTIIQVGDMVNYWCVGTTTITAYIKMECTKNGTWQVVDHNSMPCNCQVPWLSKSANPTIKLSAENTGVCPAFVRGSCDIRCIPNKDNQCSKSFMCCRKHLHSTKFCCFKPINATIHNSTDSLFVTP